MGEKPEYLEANLQLDCQHFFSLQKERKLVNACQNEVYTNIYMQNKTQYVFPLHLSFFFVSSDRSSCSDDGLLYIRAAQRQLFQIFTQSLAAIDVTSVTLSCLNSINAIDVTRYFGDIFGISWGYLGDILRISRGYLWDIMGIS